MILPSIQEKLIQYRIGLPEALLGKPATEQQLSTFEANYGAIPDDYRWFLLCYGGGVVGSERLDDIVELADSHAKFSREFGPPQVGS